MSWRSILLTTIRSKDDRRCWGHELNGAADDSESDRRSGVVSVSVDTS